MLTDLPPRLTTTEVCELARISRRTLSRRIRDGSLTLAPVDRGREMLFRTSDVIRAFDLGEQPAQPIVTASSWGNADREQIKAIMKRQRAGRSKLS